MEKTDAVKFANALGTLAEIMNKELTPLAIKAYFRALERYPAEQVEQAISQAMAECKFFPKPVELIDFITGGTQGIADQALLQAGIFVETVRRVGRYESVKFEDPVTAAVIDGSFGGWVKVCDDMTEDNEKWFRRDFEKAYRTYRRNGIECKNHLPGLAEITNGCSYPEHVPEPVMIGTKKRLMIEDEMQMGDRGGGE